MTHLNIRCRGAEMYHVWLHNYSAHCGRPRRVTVTTDAEVRAHEDQDDMPTCILRWDVYPRSRKLRSREALVLCPLQGPDVFRLVRMYSRPFRQRKGPGHR